MCRKNVKFVAIGCVHSRSKNLYPGPRWGAYGVPPELLVGWSGGGHPSFPVDAFSILILRRCMQQALTCSEINVHQHHYSNYSMEQRHSHSNTRWQTQALSASDSHMYSL